MTAEQEAPEPQAQARWDPLIRELHRLREASDMPSYATLTRDLIAQRMAAGQDEHTARIAKSSVHDAFRFGRSRINVSLVRELVRAMGGDDAEVDRWVEACGAESPSAWSPPPLPAVEDEATPPQPRMATIREQVILLAACLALNLIGREFVDFFELPIYLDMSGTAIAAIALGPWRGAAVGASTNLIGMIGSGWISLPFALVNIIGALVWGYGVRRWGMGRTLPRFFTLNVLVALACSLVAVPIIAIFLDGGLRNGHDIITDLISESINVFPLALGFSNLLTSLGDKMFSGFLALVMVSALPLALRRDVSLVATNDAGS